jgi:hypothetical protein
MSVTIIDKKETDPYILKPCDLKEGRAYKSILGVVYICNPYREIVAFSVCGALIVLDDDAYMRFKEIDLEIKEI